MSVLTRFGISLPKDLIQKFDKHIKRKCYTSRSKAFGDLVRQELIKEEWNEGSEIAGALTLVYDHHRRELLNKITDVQHDLQEVIISAQHIHLDHDNCLEIIAVKGDPKEVQVLFDRLKSLKGVKHVALSMTSTGKGLD